MSQKKISGLTARIQSRHHTERKGMTILTLILAFFVFCILAAAIGLAVLGVFILQWAGAIGSIDNEMDLTTVIVFMSVISFILGWVLLFFSIRIPLKPIHSLMFHMNRLACTWNSLPYFEAGCY